MKILEMDRKLVYDILRNSKEYEGTHVFYFF